MLISKLKLTIIILLLSVFSLVWFLYTFNGFNVKAVGPHPVFNEPKQVKLARDNVKSTNESSLETLRPDEIANGVDKEALAPESNSDTSIEEQTEHLPTFHLHFIQEVNNSRDAVCSACSDLNCNTRCSIFQEVIQNLTSKAQSIDDRSCRLHLVPLDPIVWRIEANGANSSAVNDTAERAARNFYALPSYLRFKGSDFIFLCMTNGCSEFAKFFSERLSNNRGTRAILAGIDMDWESIKWPCPLRVMDLTSNEQSSTDILLERVLKQGEQLIFKGSRWVCADETHPVNHWDRIEEGRFISVYNLKEFNFGLCVFPKGGSTMFKMFMKRLMHVKNWNISINVHGPNKNGLTTLNIQKKPIEAQRAFEDPNYIKGAIVRNPASRVISAYLGKIVRAHRYGAIDGLSTIVKKYKRAPTFEEYVNVLTDEGSNSITIERHFRSQTSYCGLNNTKFDFVGDLDHLHDDFIEFAESVGVWEEYGASGWGPNGNESIVDTWIYKSAPHKSTENIWKYFNEDLLKKVFNFYREDFEMLGYSLDELLQSKPRT
eukprot:g2161.t1